MIDQLTIEKIQSAAQITDVVSDFVTLRKRGINFVGLCPFHDDKTPSFYVSPAKNICKCFVCDAGGTPVSFVMKHEQLSYTDALKYLAKKYGIEVKEKELSEEQKQAHGDRESMFILNGFAQKTFESNLFDHIEGKSVGLSYFVERGFREDIIRKFHLGYALEQKDAFTQEALKAGYKKIYLEKTGLTIVGENNFTIDRFRGRVIFPVHSLSGKVVAFGGRILKKDEKTAKYLNSPESEVYHKGNELYGIYLARQAMVKQDKCFLVEGYTDVISMHQAGIENVVASSGTALTIGQIHLIRRFTKNVTVLYDGDSAGIKAALRGIDLLLEEGMNIKVVLLPEGEDPDSFSRKQNASSFIDFINANEADFIHFKTNLLIKEAGNDPVKKANLINEIVDTISVIPEEIIRLVYVKECSRLLDMDERALLRAIAKKRKAIAEKKTVTNKPGQNEPDRDTVMLPDDAVSSSMPENNIENIPAVYPLNKFEESLLHYVVRYGEKELYATENEETQEQIPVSVAEYIYQDLTQDDLVLENPVLKQMLDEALERIKQPDFIAERYFLNHPNPEISRLAVKFVSDKYPLSKVHSKFQKIEDESEKLRDLVPYEVLNYKDAILKRQMDILNTRIKSEQDNNNSEQMDELMSELSSLWQESKKIISKHLGERIVLKI